ncbi:MAG TPA: cell division protein SepF [Acidimicrobiales bacterium]|nr:cell division protein SepF [Acidimicrobiales bacterium]
MASMWRKAMLYLGLGPDEEYDDFDVTSEASRAAAARPVVRRPPDVHLDTEPSGAVRTLPPSGDAVNGRSLTGRNGHDDLGPAEGRAERDGAEAPAWHEPRRVPPGVTMAAERPGRERGAVVRPLHAAVAPKPFVVSPGSFNDAQEVADRFKVNVPVILNLQGVERDLARRIIDFASGLCYGLGGHMERVANQVYLLTPSDVEVSPEERRRLHERGYEA